MFHPPSSLRLRIKIVAPILATALLGLAACSSTDNDDDSSAFDATALLNDAAVHVIAATYADLAARADDLETAIAAFKQTPDSTHLEKARAQWRAARRPWEQSEAFLFGPVASEGIDPSIDSWPLNKTDLDAVLNNGESLTQAYIDGLEGTQKGFHTIEYLLFGTSNEKRASDVTVREMEYLQAVAASFSAAVHQLDSAWAPAKGNYAAKLHQAGKSGSLYASSKAALQELLTGMSDICNEVGTGKITDPFSQKDRTLEESQFSDNSVADFADNMRSVQNLFYGSYGSFDGVGIQDFIKSKNPALAATVEKAIQDAIEAIEAIKPTFGKAIFDDRPTVQKAQDAVLHLQEILDGQVRPLLD